MAGAFRLVTHKAAGAPLAFALALGGLAAGTAAVTCLNLHLSPYVHIPLAWR
jgi:hypothetical protein